MMGRKSLLILVVLLVAFMTACGNNGNNAAETPNDNASPAETAVQLSGNIEIDGSSTVFPITEAVAEEYKAVQPDVKPTVGVSGTGGGFKRFCAGETAMSNASRPIKDSEAELCKEAGVEYTELKVAFDGLSVITSKDNDFIDHLTVEELTKIFSAESTAKTWKEVRDTFPAEPIIIFSPGADSGTFDYFNEEILDKKGVRKDATFSEDDNTLVTGVAGSKTAIAFFGFAYYEENQDKLKVIPIDGGKGAITPTFDTIKDGSYAPLSRPLYVYVSKKEYERAEVKDFVKFYMDQAKALVGEVGYIPLPDDAYATEQAKL
ncbi:PstS family phosphate ABC transporter substrate-binding protein [Cohnella sp.]|uniref:PstS family phosphate ABC transporter substrate-binding protein n=1 Tax=Cohnella sp. TaxID=1883426 RepID=UPI0035652DED